MNGNTPAVRKQDYGQQLSDCGTITTPSSPTSTVTALGVGANVFQWTISNAPCASSIDQVTITGVAAPTTANAGADQSVCSTNATLAGNTAIIGTGTWTLISGAGTITTPTSPTSTVTGLGVGANVFQWTISNAPCASSIDQVTITGVAAPTTANAGADQSVCSTNATLAGNTAVVGTGTWTLISGSGTITTPSSPTSTVTALGVGANVFQWTISNAPCASSIDQVTITGVAAPTTANAGADQSVCSTNATLAGNTAIIGTGTWTLISGAGTITTPTSPTSTVTGLGVGANVFQWTISNAPCASSIDQVTITGVAAPTTANAGADQSVCSTNATLAGNTAVVGTGTWTLISGSGTITTPSSPSSAITGLGVGANVFQWTISNAPCASSSDQVTITGGATPIASTTQTNVLCFGNSTGAIDLTITGGALPLTYLWSNADTTEDITGLAAGVYTVTVNDVNNCNTSTTVTITEPATGLSLSSTQTNVLCFGNNTGAIDLTPASGTMPYTFVWSNADTTEDISNLVAGIYTVTITDANNCSTTITDTITEPATGLSLSSTQTNVLCFGNNTGAIDLTPSGGTMPYTFVWSNADTTEDISNLIAGVYTVTITDANNCSTTITDTITEPATGLSLSSTQTNVLCFGNSTGAIDLTITGGTLPFTYLWSNADTTEDITGLAAGVYTVTVNDVNNCNTSTTVTITEPATGLSQSSTQTNVLCFGNNTGAIDLTPASGTMPYTFVWSNADTTEDISNLVAGIYTVTITDANNCSTTITDTITEPATGLSLSSTQTNVLCFGNNIGAIDLTPSGGTMPYTFVWSNADTTEDISNLIAGIYTVTITDANNCSTTITDTITEPATGLSSSSTQTNVLCFGNNLNQLHLYYFQNIKHLFVCCLMKVLLQVR